MKLKTMSSKIQILLIMLIFIGPLLAFLLFYNIYTMRVLGEKIAQTGRDTLSVYQQLIENSLRDTELLLAELVANDTDFSGVARPASGLEQYMHAYKLTETMKTIQRSSPSIAGFFMYDVSSGLYHEMYTPAYSIDFKDTVRKSVNMPFPSSCGPPRAGCMYSWGTRLCCSAHWVWVPLMWRLCLTLST